MTSANVSFSLRFISGTNRQTLTACSRGTPIKHIPPRHRRRIKDTTAPTLQHSQAAFSTLAAIRRAQRRHADAPLAFLGLDSSLGSALKCKSFPTTTQMFYPPRRTLSMSSR